MRACGGGGVCLDGSRSERGGGGRVGERQRREGWREAEVERGNKEERERRGGKEEWSRCWVVVVVLVCFWSVVIADPQFGLSLLR